MNFGQATLRMMQFFERVKEASEVSVHPRPLFKEGSLTLSRLKSSSFPAYQMLVSDYFLEEAVLELTLTGMESREFCE